MYNLNQNQWANAIYSLVLLSVLISGLIIKNRQSKSRLLKQIGIWFAIIFVGVTLYNFRYEIIGAFIPNKPIFRNDNSIEIRKSANDHFYITLDINGTSVLFMVDTGASSIVLSLRDAKRVGIDIKKLKFNIPYNTANGIIYGASAKANEIKIKDIVFQDVWVSVNKNNIGTSLLGMSFLNKFKGYTVLNDRLLLYY
jgi:aspartyl protease family protein